MLTRNRKDFVSYRVYRGAESPANTDHRFRVNLISVRPRPTAGVRINTDALRNDVFLQLGYASGVRSALGTVGDLSDNVKQCWRSVRDGIVSTAQMILVHKEPIRKPWLFDYQLIIEKRKAVERGHARNRLKHAFRAKAIQDKEHYYNDIADLAESSLRRIDLKTV